MYREIDRDLCTSIYLRYPNETSEKFVVECYELILISIGVDERYVLTIMCTYDITILCT